MKRKSKSRRAVAATPRPTRPGSLRTDTVVLHEQAEGKHRIVIVSQGESKTGEWISDLELAKNGRLFANLAHADLPRGVFEVREIEHQQLI